MRLLVGGEMLRPEGARCGFRSSRLIRTSSLCSWKSPDNAFRTSFGLKGVPTIIRVESSADEGSLQAHASFWYSSQDAEYQSLYPPIIADPPSRHRSPRRRS